MSPWPRFNRPLPHARFRPVATAGNPIRLVSVAGWPADAASQNCRT